MKNNFNKMLTNILCVLAITICLKVDAQTTNYTWSNVAMGGGGFVSGIITSKAQKDLMYARTDVGGAYRWDARNQIWIPMLDWVSEEETSFLGVEALAIDPQLPNRVYMLLGINYFNGGKTAIVRSDDYGKTFKVTEVTSLFKAHGNGAGRQNGERLAVDPNNSNILFCGSRANGLFKSTDAGGTWTSLASFPASTTTNGNGTNIVLFDSTSSTKGTATKTMYVAVSRTGDNLYLSNNGGTSFTSITGGPANLMPQRAVLDKNGILYITYGDAAGPGGVGTGQVWKYNTKTANWTNITPTGITRGFGGISVDHRNTNRLIISTINTYFSQFTYNGTSRAYGDRFYLSTDGGASWRDLVGTGINVDLNGVTWANGVGLHWVGSIEFDQFNSKKAWLTSGNGVYSCDDVTATPTTWKFNVKGLEEIVPRDAVSIQGGPFVSVAFDYTGFRHTDVSQYAPVLNPASGTTTGMAYASSGSNNAMLRAGNNFLYYSTNQGTTWTQCATDQGKQGKVAITADLRTFLHCPDGSNITYYSTNNGGSWTACNGLSFNSLPVADPVNKDKVYVYDYRTGNFYRSTDGGRNFSLTVKLNDWGSSLIRTIPGREGEIWLPAGWDGLKRSTNSGTSFTKFSSVQSCRSVGFGKAAPGKTFPAIFIWGRVNNVTGVFRSIDEGATWTRVNDNDHEYGGPGNGSFVMGDWNVYGRVYMSTAGRGIVYGEPSSIVTSIEDFESKTNLVLEEQVRAFPNPFTDHLEINSNDNFDFEIFDLTGSLLERGSGNNTKQVGQSLQPGLYLLKIQIGHSSKLLKVTKN
jgi:xyloglucan-specific exo-beta-1,4-glucanase